MEKKIAYLFRENGSAVYSNWFGICYEQVIFLQNARNTVEKLNELKDYTIIDSGIDFNKLLENPNENYKPEKYRNLNKNDKLLLEKEAEKLKHMQSYPQISEDELRIVNRLKDKRTKEGLLWVIDENLGDKEKLNFIKSQMGESFVDEVVYKLSIKGEPELSGRIKLDQYGVFLKYFNGVITLRNTSKNEAKSFSTLGAPLKQEELEYLIATGIKINN